jgi:hypothetical protein
LVKLGNHGFSRVSESAGADSWWISTVELERQRAMEGEGEGEREKERMAGSPFPGL